MAIDPSQLVTTPTPQFFAPVVSAGTSWMLAAAVAAGLFLILLWRLWQWRIPARPCRWKLDSAPRGSLARWQCKKCSEQAFSAEGEKPHECKKALRAVAM